MNGRRLSDAEISRALRAHLPGHADPTLRERVLDAAETTAQQRPVPAFVGRAIELSGLQDATGRVQTNRGAWLLVAAAVLMALVASALFVGNQRPSLIVVVPRTSPTATDAASTGPSQPAVVAPRATPTATPSPTPTPLLWTQASLAEDWPAPVRAEPEGGAVIRPQTGPHLAATYPDPSGDSGSAVYPWVDIRELQGTYTRVVIDLTSDLPPLVPPTEQWIAYGVVVDDDRDGIPDRRFGIDNIPTTAPGARAHRAWITDLHTGRTVAAVGPPYGDVGGTYWDTFFPGEWTGIGARLGFGGDIAGGGTAGLRSPFYAWASVIVDGRVVATDYAPDVGWLDPSTAE